MPPFTALLHTKNDALRLGRALETLVPCGEILVVDHHSADATGRIAREYGARLVAADSQANPQRYLELARFDWIFCLDPGESITESLQASLFEWSALPGHRVVSGFAGAPAFSVLVREQIGEGWLDCPAPETRLISRGWPLWRGRLPAHEPSAVALEGGLLRLAMP
jgi:hypothetical protein